MRSSFKGSANTIDRRRFISTIAAAGAILPLSSYSSTKFFMKFTGTKNKIHVFSKPLVWIGYEELSSLLSEAGAEGIDLTVRPEGHVLPEKVEADLPKAVEAARHHGLSIDMIVTGIVSTDQPYTESIIRSASSVGIKFYRLGWMNFDEKLGIKGTIRKCRSEMKKLEEMNRKYGIHGAYQNHAGTMVGSAVWEIYELLEDLDPQFIGCQYDVRHAMVEGANSWTNGLKLLAPWIKCTNIKDFKWSETNGKWSPVSVPLGEGMVDFDEYFKLIREYNIPGPISVHFEYPPFGNNPDHLTESERRKLLIKLINTDIEKIKLLRSKYLS